MREQISALALHEKIGQLLFIGLPGAECDARTRDLLDEIKPGGVIAFARSIRGREQIRNLLDEVSATTTIPFLVGIDQEGGLVDRLRRIFTPMPAPRAVAEKGSLAEVENFGALCGETLRLLGFNLSFAPVVEIMGEARARGSANGLYSRSFGDTPETVSERARAFLDGLHSTGCLASLKHFPGLGAGAADSHEKLPVVNLTRTELENLDLAPYRALLSAPNQMQPSVMVGHAAYPRLFATTGDDSTEAHVPASLNRKIITGLLREEMNFDGLIVTDDMEMGAILQHGDFAATVVQAFNAGADMLLICSSIDRIKAGCAALLAAAESGEISSTRLDESLSRIAAFKAQLQPPTAFDAARLEFLAQEIAALDARLDYSFGGKI